MNKQDSRSSKQSNKPMKEEENKKIKIRDNFLNGKNKKACYV